ncbi:cytochrome c biogenesis protein CcsA [uncultured Flavobacterium sp.]|uniref:cytochrome c biogenesis protein CcsA n=1 Tax=uncultured Flavobacterium sp. TaxID=165435 RepID=UPI0025DEC64B|nr:cytochrome c biogenesis protein CcsA [uncultured Flavobacterium sp.]
MDKIISFFSSTRLMATLFLVFALAMGIGTFIEDAYNTETARLYIYNAWWFELIMFLFVVNFIGNIKRYQLHKKKKWATLLLHLSFIFIIVGAFVTRYISFEGVMNIREGATEKQFYSDKAYLTIWVDGEYQGSVQRRTFEEPLLFSAAEFFNSNDFTIKGDFNKIPFEVGYKDYKIGAKDTLVADPKGDQYLKLVEAGGGERHEHYLKAGEVQNIHNILFAFNAPTEGAINITKTADGYNIKSPFDGNFMRMADQMKGEVAKDTAQPLMMRSLYTLGGAMFVFPEPSLKARRDYVSDNNFKSKEQSALTVTVKSEGEEREVTLLGGTKRIGTPVSFKMGNLDYTLLYGSKIYELPFNVKLNDFIAEKHPGSETSYKSFESKVTLSGPEKEDNFDYHIYMNHVLDHKGYRFFQASYDADEKGTVLSVSHDFWGTWISYIGYFLLYIGLMVILFDKNTRFGDLKKKLDNVKARKAKLATVIALFLSLGAFAQNGHIHERMSQKQIDSLLNKYKVSEEHAAKFGRLIIQDGDRMKPANTFASELLRKVSKKDTYNGMNADQVLLSMALMDEVWYNVPILSLNRGNDSIRTVLGLPKDAKYAAFADFVDPKTGSYKLTSILVEANRAKVPNKFEEEFLDADRRLTLLNWAISGEVFRVLPVPNDKGNKWVNYREATEGKIKGLDTVKNIIPFYLQSLGESVVTGDYKLPDSLLEGLKKVQHNQAKDIMPSDDKVEAEILYNKYDIFKKLYSYYMLAGVLMMLFVILKIFKERKWLRIAVNIFYGIIMLLLVLHTLGLIARWYISGHAPWSNAYESVIYVGWATVLFGFLLSAFSYQPVYKLPAILKAFFGLSEKHRSELTVASSAFVGAIVLWVAHLNWTDPDIGNLVPVLDSYWLMIHVAVIVGCYGPFTLAFMLGIVAMVLMIFTNKDNKERMDLNIKEITYINEMALTVGLVMLTIGNFLGGQWANESWGRYWGWDPKETWALVSIMVYAFVIHMRFVPLFRSRWTYSFFSVLAFASILMTYFGVNFYLTGLHSYASGEVRTPAYFLYLALGVFALGIVSYIQFRKHLRK